MTQQQRDEVAKAHVEAVRLYGTSDFAPVVGTPTPEQFEYLYGYALEEARGVKLRLIDDLLVKAHGVILQDHIERAGVMRVRALRLFAHGEFVASMEAGQALFEFANGLNFAIGVRKDVKAARRSAVGAKVGGQESGIARRGASSKRAKILHELSKYTGSEAARVATVARKTGATPTYVRAIIKKAKL